MFSFEVLAKDKEARLGRLLTPHGPIDTPCFVPVGTWGAVRGLTHQELRQVGSQAIIANTYHLHLQPGEELIEKMGGLHKFLGWKGPIITDSGGFQIFSLGAGKEHGMGKIASIFPRENRAERPVSSKTRPSLVRVDEDGVEFASYLDGSKHRFTPESVIHMEQKLGADLILPLDECTSPFHGFLYTKSAMDRTHRWALRSLRAFQRNGSEGQALFGIVQGGAYRDLREESARFISSQGFTGYAIGGALGRSREDMHQILGWTLPLLPQDRPRHLLGIGDVEDIFEVIKRGIDLMDCVTPTRLASTGTLFVKDAPRFRIHISNARYREECLPIEKDCRCYACRHYSRGYLRHLFSGNDPLGRRLAAIHNLYFIESLMRQIRRAIHEETLDKLELKWRRPGRKTSQKVGRDHL